MPLIAQAMLDFSELTTPANHGDILISPAPHAWMEAAHANQAALSHCDRPLLGSTLGHWRGKIREAVVGCGDALVFVTGHQPEFIHPGVWAKHVAAVRAAGASGGVAVNLVVDSDTPKHAALRIPSVVEGDLTLRNQPFASFRTGCAYEQMEAPGDESLSRFGQGVREALAGQYESSLMPTYLSALCEAGHEGDWVDRLIHARRAVEGSLGVTLTDRRVSRYWAGPLLLDMLANAERFSSSYNRALASYRRANRVRGPQRPIPDLHHVDGRIELPVWAYRADQPRRRLFVESVGGSSLLFAEEARIAEIPKKQLNSNEGLEAFSSVVGDWRIRPRALALTIWARLLLADLFIHGIGGAKYDRISDAIIADYYGVTPPNMACVSATLHMDLPFTVDAPRAAAHLSRDLRDLRYNPHRHLASTVELDSLFAQRAQAVGQAVDLRDNDRGNHTARDASFHRIRELNQAALAMQPEALSDVESRLEQALRDLRQYRTAHGRDYFFALYARARLNRLLDALPQERDFRV